MQIMNKTVVGLTWTLKDSLGEELDTLDQPVEFYVGGADLLPTIEEALQGKQVGDAISLYLEPEHAFGDYDENLVFLEPRDLFPRELEEGMVFEASALDGHLSEDMDPTLLLTVTEIYPEHVVLDGNHPLAGIALRLDAKVQSVRPSSPAEQRAASAGAGFFRIAPELPDEPPPSLH
ncbi:peptidylprolyl isomerase [Corticibacter populi]|uniref:Peptidyl-prolyl cis-trans isomerase n=1 Tax=Corticibacter populi TaxID=1550736 RepID=A0A3M6R0N7_9BURK|nr:FKBP-type peptidyl-prolyl cis-trans isomerase [Corticibacter populi]RMX08810.1 peptidylprolyl isomerase [Corticibacter populi]